MKLELPSSFRPPQKLITKLEAGKSIKGFVSHKSLAEIIVQTRAGDLILPISDDKLSKGQQVVVFKNALGKMFLETVPGSSKNLSSNEIPIDLFKSGKSVIINVNDKMNRDGDSSTEKVTKSSEIYSRLINKQSPEQALFGVIVRKISNSSMTRVEYRGAKRFLIRSSTNSDL